jgi:hypothetical protein
MSYVIAVPEMMAATATDLASISTDLSAAHSAAAQATVALTPAAADEVSVGIAHLFSEHAQGFHALAGKAAVFHEQFAQNLKAGAASYVNTEDAIAALLGSIASLLGYLRNLNPLRLLEGLATDPGFYLFGLLFLGAFFVLPLLLLLSLPILWVIRTVQGLLGLPVLP